MRTRNTLLHRAAASVTAVGVTLAGSVLLAPAAHSTQAAKPQVTPYAYQGEAYGTRVLGGSGDGSVDSGRTAWATLGCTTVAPKKRGKKAYVGKVNADSAIDVGAVTSTTRSYRRAAAETYGSRSVTRLADVVLGDPQGAHLRIGALRAVADSFAKRGRLGSAATVDWTDLDITLAPGEEPAPDSPLGQLVGAINDEADKAALQIVKDAGKIQIPQVGTISFGWTRTPVNQKGGVAAASVYALKVELSNGSTASLGRGYSRINRGLPAGVFWGGAHAGDGSALDGLVSVGKIAAQPLPCAGTKGQTRTNGTKALFSTDAFDLRQAVSLVRGRQLRNGAASAVTSSSVRKVDIGGGQLVAEAITGQANIRQTPDGRVVTRNIDGTAIGSISGSGVPEGFEVPAPGESAEIPGLARIESAVTKRTARGVRVTALRITMLDGSGLVINIGNAAAFIYRK